MRLTNQMREDFVNSVMRKVRRRQKWSREACAEEINKRLAAALPADIKQFVSKHPDLVCRETKTVDLWRTSEGHRQWTYVSMVLNQKLSDVDVEDLKKHYALWVKEDDRRKEMAVRLREVAYSVTTNTDLATALPDLVKFIPKDEPKVKKLLPVANSQLFRDLKTLGLEVEK
jgi:hypothetical protein